MSLRFLQTITEQVAAHLHEQLSRGRWSREMPGQKQLAKLLGVSGKTGELALVLIEKDGILVGQGTDRHRRIVLPHGGLEGGILRVAVLGQKPSSQNPRWLVQALRL